MGLQEFFGAVKNADIAFTEIRNFVLSVTSSAAANPDFANIWQFIKNSYNTYLLVSSVIAITIAIAIGFFGQKMTGVLKFCLFFMTGFVTGVEFLFPLLPESISIKAWIIGLIAAIIVAVLYKYLYFVLLIISVGYSVYRICFTGFFIAATAQYTAGKALVSLGVAAAAVILALIFNKWIERLLTACLGGAIAAFAFNYGVYRFTALSFLVGREWLGIVVVAGVIALIGFFYQVKRREIY